MAIILLLVIIGAIVFGIAAGATVLNGMKALGTGGGAELRATKYQLKAARKALYPIANGTAGNPALEAQIALDEIDRKELES